MIVYLLTTLVILFALYAATTIALKLFNTYKEKLHYFSLDFSPKEE